MAAVHRSPAGRRCGESHPRAKHTDDEVRAVRDLHDQGLGWRRISRILALPPKWVKDVCSFAKRPYVPLMWPPRDDRGPADRLR